MASASRTSARIVQVVRRISTGVDINDLARKFSIQTASACIRTQRYHRCKTRRNRRHASIFSILRVLGITDKRSRIFKEKNLSTTQAEWLSLFRLWTETRSSLRRWPRRSGGSLQRQSERYSRRV